MKRKFILCAVLVCLFWCSSTVVRADPPDYQTGELWNSHTAAVQQQAIALHTLGAPAYSGRALLAESELLALDEPFTGLDESARRTAAQVILRCLEGRTLLLITHRPEDLPLLNIRQEIRW